MHKTIEKSRKLETELMLSQEVGEEQLEVLILEWRAFREIASKCLEDGNTYCIRTMLDELQRNISTYKAEAEIEKSRFERLT